MTSLPSSTTTLFPTSYLDNEIEIRLHWLDGRMKGSRNMTKYRSAFPNRQHFPQQQLLPLHARNNQPQAWWKGRPSTMR